MKDFLYYIVERDGRVRQVVNGVVTSLGKKTPVPAPEGWQDKLIGWERMAEWHGVGRWFSVPMKFYLDGYTILTGDLYKFGVRRELYLLIQQFTTNVADATFRRYYKFLYKGQLDMTTAEDDNDVHGITINILEGGTVKLLKAGKGTKFEVPFTDAIHVRMDGIVLSQKANYILVSELPILKSLYGTNFFLPFSYINSDGRSTGLVFFSQDLTDVTGDTWSEKLLLDKYPVKANQNNPTTTTANITGVVEFTCTDNDPGVVGFRGRFIRSQQDIANQNDYEVFSVSPIVVGQDYRFDIDIDIPLQPGERLYFEGIYFGGSTGAVDVAVEFSENSKLSVNYTGRHPEKIIKYLRPITVYKSLCVQMGIEADKAVSFVLEACTYCLTSGDALRGVENPVLKTSFNEFFKAYDVYLSGGLRLKADGELSFTDRAGLYNPVDPIELGEVRKLRTKPAVDLMYTSIKFGHAEQDINDVNGKYDFNGVMVLKTPITEISERELDLQSPYKAGPFEIDIVISGFDGKTTTDGQADNDVFVADVDLTGDDPINTTVSFVAAGSLMFTQTGLPWVVGQRIRITGSVSNDGEYDVLAVEGFIFALIVVLSGPALTDEPSVPVTVEFLSGAVYSLNRPTYSALEGVPDPDSIFNVALHPALLIRNHFRWLRSWLYGYETEKLVVTSVNRNRDMVIGDVDTDADIPISIMGLPIFKPWYLTFEPLTPTDMVELLEADELRPFSFIRQNEEFVGFTKSASLAPNTLETQEYTILSGPDNDLEWLIK